MTGLLTENLPLLAGAPNGIKQLRSLIFNLAIRGKLVEQDPTDEPAEALVRRITAASLEAVNLRRPKPITAGIASIADAPPYTLPEGWLWTNLASITQVNPRNSSSDDVSVAFVPMAQIGAKFDSGHGQEARKWGEVKQGFTHFAEGDIAVAKITPCFENSKACVFRDLTNGLGAGTTELHVVRPIAGTLAPRYVLAYLKSPWFLLVGETRMTGTAGQKRLPKAFVEQHPFPLPPLAEQHRIVAKVDELMALCDRLEAQQADAEAAHAQLVEALLASLTQARDAADFRASWQQLAEHFHTLFTTEDSVDALKQALIDYGTCGRLSGLLEFDDIPNGWSRACLGDVVTASGAGWSPSCEGRPRTGAEWGVLKVSAVSWSTFRPDENKALPAHLEPRTALEVQAGDFLVSRANTAELVARSVLVESTPPRLMLSDKIVRLKLSDACNAKYVQFANSSTLARSYYAKVAGGTSSSMKNVSRPQILALPILLPPLLEQHRIVAKVDEFLDLCDQLKLSVTQARQHHEHLASVLVEQAVA